MGSTRALSTISSTVNALRIGYSQPIETLYQVLWLLPIFGYVYLAFRIVQAEALRRYPFLFAYAVLDATLTMSNLAVQAWCSRHAYALVWMITQAPLMVSLLGAAVELYVRIIEHFQTLKRPHVAGVFAFLAAAGCVASLPLDIGKIIWNAPDLPLRLVLISERIVTSGIFFFFLALFLTSVVLRRRWRRNVRVSWGGMQNYTLIQSLSMFSVNVYAVNNSRAVGVAINSCGFLLLGACLYRWARNLNPSGEQLIEAVFNDYYNQQIEQRRRALLSFFKLPR